MPPWEKYQKGPWSRYGKQEGPGIGGALRQGMESLPRAGQAINQALGVEGAPITEFIEKHTGMSLPRLMTPQKPQTIPEYAAQGVGETAGALIPGTALFKGLSGLGGVTGQVGKAVTGTLQRAPATAAATDVLAGAGAGAARGGAQELPEFPGRDALAELTGGIVAGGVPAAVGATARGVGGVAQKLPVTGTVIRGAKKAIIPFTESGARARAEDRVRSLVADPEAAARAIADDSLGNLSPAQRTGEKRLMALEKAVMDSDPAIDAKLSEKAAESLKRLRGSFQGMGQGGDIGSTREFIGSRRDRIVEALNTRAEQASARAERRLAELGPNVQPAEASRVVREEIDDALGAAIKQERELWDLVPESVEVSTKGAKAALRKMLVSLPKAQRDLIPSKAKKFLAAPKQPKRPGFKARREGAVVTSERSSAFGDVETIKEMQGLRSDLLEDARVARSENKFNKARIIDQISDALLEDMNRGPGEELAAARDFSRVVKEKFKQGSVGKLLGYAREGGQKTPADLTLETTVGRGGIKGDVALQDLGRAVEEDPTRAMSAVDQYLRSKFVSPQGEFDVRRAEAFMRMNDEILDRLPTTLRRQLDQGIRARAAADAMERTGQMRINRLQNPAISKAAEFLNTPIDREIPRILNGKNPEATLRELRKQASKDLSGEALRGLKAGVVDHLMNKSALRQFDDAGQQILSGRGLNALLQDNRTMKAVSSVLSSDEVSRLQRIASELTKMETARGRLPDVGKPMDDLPNSVIHYIGTVLAARQGAALGAGTSGASLKTASEASKRFGKVLARLTNDSAEELIKDAIDDPKLFRALLMRTGGKGAELNRKIVTQRMNAWLAGPGSRVLEDEDG